jgi:hypothetical protein
VGGTVSIRWVETGLGWKAGTSNSQVLLLVNRAHRGGGFSWEFSALAADDDARGMAPTDVAAKALAEKAYAKWIGNRLG